MCGICGYYNTKEQAGARELKAMCMQLAHRGPDAEGTLTDGPIALGHQRLSILGLNPGANQPMRSDDGCYSIVYNGEVYNYRQLARELKLEIKSGSDTEVIVNAYARLKDGLPNRMNGMFAMAILDHHKQELYLCRDRMGIKPLYYYHKDGALYFASELKSLLASKHVRANARISSEAINNYLHLGYIPEPLSIYTHIYKFPAGSHGWFTAKGLTIEPYWTIDEHTQRPGIDNASQAKNHLRELIEASVEKRLMSDVPYGSFLSGGTDSSLVTAIASRKSDKRLKTFTIGFSESKHNEAPYAKRIAEHLGTEHHEYYLSEQQALELCHEIVPTYDEPYADSSAIPTMLVSQMASREVKMVLSGDGGDELFHGYGAYHWANRLARPHLSAMRKPIAWLLSQMSNRHQRAAKLFDYGGPHQRSHIFSQEQYLYSRKEISKLLHKQHRRDILLNEQAPSHYSTSDAQALFDLRYYLKDDLLVKVDRASMKYGLEARVPLLDHEIVEYALAIDGKLKMNPHGDKWLLKELLYEYVPKAYFNRPKWGFSIPLNKWLKTDLAEMRKHYLSARIIDKHGLMDSSYLKRTEKAFLNGKDYLYNRLWQIMVLNIWLENNGH